MGRYLLAIPFIFLAVGCGAKESSLDDSGSALKDAGSSRVEWRLEGGSEISDWARYTTRGVVDYKNDRGDFVMESKGSSGPELRALYIGRDMYMGMVLEGKMRWLKDSSGYKTTGTDQFMPGPAGPSPDALLEKLVQASKRVEVLEKEEIRGVQAIHYRAHVDETKLGEQVDDLESPSKLVIDAWIDDNGLARRIRIPYGGEKGPASIVDLFDFGVPVDVEAPPADEILSDAEFGKLADEECAKAAPENSGEGDGGVSWACLMFGSSGSDLSSGSSGEISPTETMPRTVTEPR